jgi:hypothetical protein
MASHPLIIGTPTAIIIKTIIKTNQKLHTSSKN